MKQSSSVLALTALVVLATCCNNLAVVDARRPPSGGRVPSASSRTAPRGGRSGGGSGGRVSSSSRNSKRRQFDDEDEMDDDDEEDEMNFGFLDDNAYDEELDEPEEEEDDFRGRPSSRASAPRGRGGRGSGRNTAAAAPRGRGRNYQEQEYDDDYDMSPLDVEDEEDYYDPIDEPTHRRGAAASPRGRNAPHGRRSPTGGNSRSAASTSSSSRSSRGASSRGASSGRGSGGGGSTGGRRGGRGSGNVVPYGRDSRVRRHQPQPSAFTRGLAALRESIPDPTTLKDSAINSMSAARQTTSKLTSNIYREVKGLTSSELEQVMLKATAPNDLSVKGKHVERLVGVTYQISGRYDIYDAVLRKLWSKMVEKDWRTTVKSLYVLHRFSADGAPDHQAALKARLRELRRARDPKNAKEKYFNSKMLLSGDTSPATIPFRAFLSRYAHYVLLRAQCFGGMFTEIANDPNKSKQSKPSSSKSRAPPARKCITSTCLKNEHLEAAQMLLKAGLACELKSNGEEECENTVIPLERVVADLIGLTEAVATALNNALCGDYDNDSEVDWDLIKKWCEFYSSELLVKTKDLKKRTIPTLDAYGLFLPSRWGASVSQDLLQKGLKGSSSEEEDLEEKISKDEVVIEEDRDINEEERASVKQEEVNDERDEEPIEEKEVLDDDNGYDYDEYEYEEYEYE